MAYQEQKIWDRFIRLWHWLLVLSVVSGWLLGYFRTFSIMQWHMYAGYTTGVLLIARCWWGFKGPHEVRFRSILKSTFSVFKYLPGVFKKSPSGIPGHNPLGSLSVIAILLLLALQVTSGLFAEDDGLFYEGPLSKHVSDSMVLRFNSIHHTVANALPWLIGLHVAAIVFYQIWKKENLTKAMITGWKTVKVDQKDGDVS